MKTLLLLFLSISLHAHLPIERVIIWGHPLHSHTHSYIHWGFSRAFKHLGYETHWVTSTKELEDVDLKNSLFLTAGTCDHHIPIRSDCWYILHNCDSDKYTPIMNANRAIIMQVYTHDVLPRNVTQVEPFIFRSVEDQILYMPWATDLLPDEIEENKQNIETKKSNCVYWVGTVWRGHFGNRSEINAFQKACGENDISFQTRRNVTMQENKKLIQQSYMAPALQGAWQCEHGYIPCRIFKNISYGQMGITNSQTVYELFEHNIVYNSDCYQLFYDAQEKITTMPNEELFELMDFVKQKHTYLNRIDHLLQLLYDVFNKDQ